MEYTEETLRRLQEVLKEICTEIIRVCDENGIGYFIQGGTAMGAFFFSDILPWDDDMDLGMTMDDYRRFIEIAPQKLRPGFSLQVFETEPDTPFYFAKVRKDDTLFLEPLYRELKIHHGIYVDVFPYNRIPNGRTARSLQRTAVRFLINCFISKTIWLWKPLSHKRDGERGELFDKSLVGGLAIKFHSFFFSKAQLYAQLMRTLTLYDRRPCKDYNIVRMPKDMIPAEDIEHSVLVRLGDMTVRCPRHVERYLRNHYGPNIQKYPPAHLQVNHAPLEIRFGDSTTQTGNGKEWGGVSHKSPEEISFSVVIPLYNKEHEIGRAIQSVLAQSLLPREIIVVDDGSTDSGPGIAGSFHSPLVRIIHQDNFGVSIARNRGIGEATGTHIALLDADDWWDRRYLERMAALICDYPGCGAYSSAFDIISGEKRVRASTPTNRGIVHGFFRQAMERYICQPSSTIIPRSVFDAVGGFPAGMRLGEDQYMWIKIARQYDICFSPECLVSYCRTASNRSSAIYRSEQTEYSFEDFHDNGGDEWQNEFLARCAIGKALTLSAKGDTAFGLRTERFFCYTKHYRRGWWKLRILNRTPRCMRAPLHALYNRLAWALAHKGL